LCLFIALPAHAGAEAPRDDQAALELFRQAAEEPSRGYLFSPKAETLNSKTPIPQYAERVRLFKLLLLDAKSPSTRKQPRLVEKDLLAAAGFLVQLSEQKSGVLATAFVQQLCLREAYPVLSEVLRGPGSSPAFLSEISARLARVGQNQDFLQAAFREEGSIAKGSLREGVNPEMEARQRANLPLWKRLASRRTADSQYFPWVYKRFDAETDERTRALISAARDNDPKRFVDFRAKREEEIASRRRARESRGLWAAFQAGLKGGESSIVGEELVDTMLSLTTPRYEKMIQPYHAFLCELNVLRAGLAVKRYLRARKRLPEDLDWLVPAFLSAVPLDSFNAFKPLRYVRTGKKFSVYSLGPDGREIVFTD